MMIEPHWASAYTNVYEATQVTSPIPWLTGAPVSLSDWLFLLYVVGVVVTLLWYLISWLRLCLLLRQGDARPGGRAGTDRTHWQDVWLQDLSGHRAAPVCRPRWCAGCSARCWPCRGGKRWMTM
ncbi:MAG: hypothetical protein ACLUNZ_08540 [Evtepia sp.]